MKSGDDYVTLTAVGDIMLGWGVEERIKAGTGRYPFDSVAPILQSSDITFGNLEAPLTTEQKKAVWDYTKILDKPVMIDGKMYGSSIYCKADPIAAERLSRAGFNVLSIANNHIMDYGEEGLYDTIYSLSKNNIAYVGAGKDLFSARVPKIFEIKGIKIGFLAYCDTYVAGKRKAGVAPTSKINEDINNLKILADHVIVSIHQGSDISEYPSRREIDFLHMIIDQGAILVLRHHPHVVQGMEYYKKGLILYSLGNFVFDFTIDPLWKDIEKARSAIIFKCIISKEGITKSDIIPVHLNNLFQPEPLVGDEKFLFLKQFNGLSTKIAKIEKNEIQKNGLNIIQVEIILAYHVLLASIKKRQFQNVLLILKRIDKERIRLVAKLIKQNGLMK